MSARLCHIWTGCIKIPLSVSLISQSIFQNDALLLDILTSTSMLKNERIVTLAPHHTLTSLSLSLSSPPFPSLPFFTPPSLPPSLTPSLPPSLSADLACLPLVTGRFCSRISSLDLRASELLLVALSFGPLTHMVTLRVCERERDWVCVCVLRVCSVWTHRAGSLPLQESYIDRHKDRDTVAERRPGKWRGDASKLHFATRKRAHTHHTHTPSEGAKGLEATFCCALSLSYNVCVCGRVLCCVRVLCVLNHLKRFLHASHTHTHAHTHTHTLSQASTLWPRPWVTSWIPLLPSPLWSKQMHVLMCNSTLCPTDALGHTYVYMYMYIYICICIY